jgi:hypothetical protein
MSIRRRVKGRASCCDDGALVRTRLTVQIGNLGRRETDNLLGGTHAYRYVLQDVASIIVQTASSLFTGTN